MTFYGAVYNHTLTQTNSHSTGSSCDQPSLVGRALVRATNPRSAAAKLYVRCIGRPRARLLTTVQAAGLQLRGDTDWRDIAPALMRTSDRLTHSYCLDNAVESWFIAVQPAPFPLPSRRCISRRSLLRRLRRPPRN